MIPNARFAALLADIEPSATTKKNSVSAHTNVRRVLAANVDFGWQINRIILGGSYKRDTAIRPRTKNGKIDRPDVDLYVVVDGDPSFDRPEDLTNDLFDALNSRNSRSELGITRLKRNRVSIAVSMNNADLDVSLLLERQWDDLYRIGNRETNEWYLTDPEEHASWSAIQNANFGKRFKPMAKLLKWARRENPTSGKHPKSFAIERFLAELLDANEAHYGRLFYGFCNSFLDEYSSHRALGLTPTLSDPAVDGGNLLEGVSGDDFCAYYDKLKKHRDDAARALAAASEEDAAVYWRRIFGQRFPVAKSSSAAASTLREAATMSPLTFGSTQAMPSPRPAKFAS